MSNLGYAVFPRSVSEAELTDALNDICASLLRGAVVITPPKSKNECFLPCFTGKSDGLFQIWRMNAKKVAVDKRSYGPVYTGWWLSDLFQHELCRRFGGYIWDEGTGPRDKTFPAASYPCPTYADFLVDFYTTPDNKFDRSLAKAAFKDAEPFVPAAILGDLMQSPMPRKARS